MIELVGVSKRYGQNYALRDVSLAVPEGRTTVLIGQSGCGKSTLLRLVNGLIAPDAGQVLIDGRPLQPDNLRTTRHRMGYVIQEGGLFPHLTARANICLLGRHLGRPPEQLAARVAELAELVHLRPALLERYPRELSGGQRQRVSLMRALLLNPDVLLLDEPLGALDPIIRRKLQTELREIFRQLGKTVLLVTHDLAEAGYFGDTIALLRAGELVQVGSMQDLVARPAETFVTSFVQAQRALVDLQADAS